MTAAMMVTTGRMTMPLIGMTSTLWLSILLCHVLSSTTAFQLHKVTAPTRRPEVGRLSMAATNPLTPNEKNPRLLVSEGMQSFRRGNIQESIDLFDQADSLVSDGSLRPFLWQRGISYYYADRFQDGSDQVRFVKSVSIRTTFQHGIVS